MRVREVLPSAASAATAQVGLRALNHRPTTVLNHMLGGSPNFVFLHFQGRGDAASLAKTVRNAWDQLGAPRLLKERKAGTAPKLDTKALSEVMELPGTMMSDGMYKIGLSRAHLGATLDGRPLPAGMGAACWVGFAPCECGLTMIMGDTCLLRGELQKAIDTYRRHGIRIVAIHNHQLATNPELIFCHFAGEGEALELARAVHEAWSPLAAPKPPRCTSCSWSARPRRRTPSGVRVRSRRAP